MYWTRLQPSATKTHCTTAMAINRLLISLITIIAIKRILHFKFRHKNEGSRRTIFNLCIFPTPASVHSDLERNEYLLSCSSDDFIVSSLQRLNLYYAVGKGENILNAWNEFSIFPVMMPILAASRYVYLLSLKYIFFYFK